MNTTSVNHSDGMATLKARIASTIAAYPGLPDRWKAMKKIKWRMVCPALGMYAALDGLNIVAVTERENALLFDARDNQETKLRFYRASTGIHWEIECV